MPKLSLLENSSERKKKVKVKLSLCTLWKHAGKVQVHTHSFWNLVLDGGGQLHA
jgi:hypothetical protein